MAPSAGTRNQSLELRVFRKPDAPWEGRTDPSCRKARILQQMTCFVIPGQQRDIGAEVHRGHDLDVRAHGDRRVAELGTVQSHAGDACQVSNILGGQVPALTRQPQPRAELGKELILGFGEDRAGRHENHFIQIWRNCIN